MNQREHLSRRSVLKGLTLGSGALGFVPLLGNVAAHAAGDETALPQRFVFVIKSSGLGRKNLVPAGIDVLLEGGVAWNDAERGLDFTRTRLLDEPLANRRLPKILEPFETIKDKLTIVQGLSGKNFNGNHTAGYGTLSCINSEKVPLAPTLDYMLGKHFSEGPYPMYAMALNGTLIGGNSPPEDGYCYPNISARGKARPVAFQASPEKAFQELFGSAVLPPDQAKQRLAVTTNLMDFLRDDARRISRHLRGDEKDKFENYTQAFESLKVRKRRMADYRNVIQGQAPEFTDLYHSAVETERQKCQFQIATAALITGLTNVVTLRPDTLGTVYTGFGMRGTGVHALGHGRQADNGWEAMRARKEIDKYHLSLIAEMAHKLKSIPEGNGTMLDRTLIVYTSCAGGAHHSGQADWPYVLVGGVRGKLRMGRYLQYPSYLQQQHKTIANLYMAILEAAGLYQGEHFGQIDNVLKDHDLDGPLSEMLVTT